MKHTILIVDDFILFRDPIAASLRLAGYETLCAGNGKEALQLLQTHRPALILLDLAMPDMDGLTFLTRLQSDAQRASIPVILLSAITERDYLDRAKTLGVRDHLLKSRFRLDDLLTRIRKHLPDTL